MALPTTADQIRAKAPADGIDPNVKIPRNITAQGERAEAIQRAITGQPTADSNPPSPSGDLPRGAPVDAPGQPQEDPSTPQSEIPPAVGGEAEAAQPQDWERRFKGLQGRYDSDVRKVRESVNQMSDQIRQLQQENASLRMAAPSPVPPEGTPPVETLLTPQEIEDYGQEFVDVSRRIAREVAAPLEAEIRNLRAGLGSVQQETGNSFMTRMDQSLGQLVGPQWQQLNRDERFVAWTKLPDVFSGAIRGSLMQEAWNAGDARRVAAFFQAYLAEEAAVDPQRANGQARPPQFNRTVSPVTPPTEQAPQLALEDLAAPGRAHSAGSNPAEKPVYTSADLTRFWTDVAHGKWRGREQQQAAVEADIMQAQKEGRIIVDQRSILPFDPRAPQR